jgi:hypothetical protein
MERDGNRVLVLRLHLEARRSSEAYARYPHGRRTFSSLGMVHCTCAITDRRSIWCRGRLTASQRGGKSRSGEDEYH